jgi:5'-nucleotidase
LDLLLAQDGQGAWHVGRYRARLIPITAAIPADEAVAAVVARYWQPLAGRYGEIVGQAAADFVSIHDDLAEYNLVADAIRETFASDIVLENIGGVRAPLVEGPITRADLVAMDPFDNTIVTFKVSGAALKRLLLKQRPAVSGLRYRIEGGALTEAAVAGQPVAEDRIYSAAANSFIARHWLKGLETQDSGRRRRDVVIDYIRRKGAITPAYDGRRVILSR